MILLPLGLATFSLYFNRMQSIEPRIKSLDLNAYSYENQTLFAVFNGTSRNLEPFLTEMINSGVAGIDFYDGNYSMLLDIGPHMAAFNINSYNDPEYSITMIYNDTAQHSLPIVINIINNALYR